MSRVEEIKAQIDALSWQERCELNVMLQNWPDDEWDRELAAEGKFDRINVAAHEEYRAGKCRPGPGA
jgi:hypothetical protein